MRPHVHVVCQLKNSENIMFLMAEDLTEKEADITMCPPFAAGQVFVDSVLDRLMYTYSYSFWTLSTRIDSTLCNSLRSQAMYNVRLLPILRELIISGEYDPQK